MATGSDSFRMNPITLCALVGGVVAFVVTGAIVDVISVAIGAGVGSLVGLGVRRWGARARTYADAVDLRDNTTKTELMEEARRLDVPGRTNMDKDELARAVGERRAD